MRSFKPCIRIYRDSLQEYLDILAASKSASRAAPEVAPPSNFEAAREAEVEPPAEATTGPFLKELLKTLFAFFRPSNWPNFRIAVSGSIPSARPLRVGYQQGRDIWPICQSSVVNESEFCLVDQLYNVSEVHCLRTGLGLPNSWYPDFNH